MGIPDHLTCLLRNLYAGQEATVRTRKGVCRDCILSPCLFNLYADIAWEMLDWMKYKLESRLLGETSITSNKQMIPPYGRKWRTKEPLDESERQSEKVGLKRNTQKPKIMASGPIISWQIDGETRKKWETLFLEEPKSLQVVTTAMKLKDACSLEEKLSPT